MEMILNHIEFAENRPLDGYSIGGELYFSVGDSYFPVEHWYDFAFRDLKTWMPGLISFGSNHTDSCEFSFMDGPYTIGLTRRGDGVVRAEFLRNHIVVDSEQDVDMHTLLESALSCCRIYDRFLYDNGAPNQFTDEIRMLKTILILKIQEKYHV